MREINRVFFHELGHFVAGELNAQHYGTAPVKRVEIYICDHILNRYCGELTFDITSHPGARDAPNVKTLACYLASSIYGSVFQSIFLGQKLNEAVKQNGSDDFSKWWGALRHNNLSSFKSEFVDVENSYCESLRENLDIKNFFDLDPSEFLFNPSPEAINFYIDIPALRDKIHHLVDTHFAKYQELITGHQEIIDKNVLL